MRCVLKRGDAPEAERQPGCLDGPPVCGGDHARIGDNRHAGQPVDGYEGTELIELLRCEMNPLIA